MAKLPTLGKYCPSIINFLKLARHLHHRYKFDGITRRRPASFRYESKVWLFKADARMEGYFLTRLPGSTLG